MGLGICVFLYWNQLSFFWASPASQWEWNGAFHILTGIKRMFIGRHLLYLFSSSVLSRDCRRVLLDAAWKRLQTSWEQDWTQFLSRLAFCRTASRCWRGGASQGACQPPLCMHSQHVGVWLYSLWVPGSICMEWLLHLLRDRHTERLLSSDGKPYRQVFFREMSLLPWIGFGLGFFFLLGFECWGIRKSSVAFSFWAVFTQRRE